MGGSALTAGMLKSRAAAPLSGFPSTERFSVQLCESVSRLLGNLSPVPFRVTPDGVEEGLRPEAAEGMVEAMLKSATGQMRVFLDCDRLLVFALTDAALGGTDNKPPAIPEQRPLSGIEKEIRNLLMSRIMQDLPELVATGYGIEPLEIDGDARLDMEQSAFLCFRLLVNVFSYSGEIRLGLNRDALTTCLEQVQASGAVTATLRDGLADCLASIVVTLSAETLTVGEVSRLVPGQLLTLQSSVTTPVLGMSGGVQLFSGTLTRSGERLAVKII